MFELWEGQRLTGRAKLDVAVDLENPDITGHAAIVSQRVVAQDLLTTWQILSFEIEVKETVAGKECFTKDIPHVNGDALAQLDEQGVIRVGTKVKQDDLLVGKICPRRDFDLTSEERLVGAIFGGQLPDRLDVSFRWPYRDEGTVLEVNKLGDPNCPSIVRLKVGVPRNLREGDLIEEIQTKNTLVVAKVALDLPEKVGDMLVGQFALSPGKKQFKKLTQFSEQKWLARSIGPYSFSSEMPLMRGPNPGQRLTTPQITNLTVSGFPTLIRELLTIKSGAVEERVQAYESILRGTPIQVQGIVEVVKKFFFILRGLGFNPKLVTNQGEEHFITDDDLPERPMAIKIGLAQKDDILGWSMGEVKKPDGINFRTFRPEPDGLYCERIFGPTRDWECHCGKYRQIKFRGTICDRCGVEVSRSNVRRNRMGHINLPVPMVHPWLIPTIAKKLDLSLEIVDKIVHYKAVVVVDPGESSFQKGEIVEGDIKYLDTGTLSGTAAIQWLAEVKGIDLRGLFLEVFPVIPADLRPIVQIDSGRWASSDLNDFYRRLINRVNRCSKVMFLNASLDIIWHELRLIQLAIDKLIDNRNLEGQILGNSNRPLASLVDELQISKRQLFERRVDYSGQGIVIPDQELKYRHIGLPREFALELFKPFVMKALVDEGLTSNVKSASQMVQKLQSEVFEILPKVIKNYLVLAVSEQHAGPIFTFLRPVVTEKEALSLNPKTAACLHVTFSGEKLIVHLPLSGPAQAEAKNFLYPSARPRNNQSGAISTIEYNLKDCVLESKLIDLYPDLLVDLAIEGSIRSLTDLDRTVLGFKA